MTYPKSTPARRIAAIALAVCAAASADFLPRGLVGTAAAGGAAVKVDTALVLAVDVSDSVDAERYRLQMEGIARALEDDGVIAAITSGAHGGIALALVTWADKGQVSLDWQIIRSVDDANRVAMRIRSLPQVTGEFTCMARMMKLLKESVVDALPVEAARTVIDVSGDGIDNCDYPAETKRRRDDLLALGITINGLPIIVQGENETVGAGAYRAPGLELNGGANIGPASERTTLDQWYKEFVVGGPANFLLPAHGFEDFGRAFRQKFVTEISANPDGVPRGYAALP